MITFGAAVRQAQTMTAVPRGCLGDGPFRRVHTEAVPIMTARPA